MVDPNNPARTECTRAKQGTWHLRSCGLYYPRYVFPFGVFHIPQTSPDLKPQTPSPIRYKPKHHNIPNPKWDMASGISLGSEALRAAGGGPPPEVRLRSLGFGVSGLLGLGVRGAQGVGWLVKFRA